MYKKIEEYMKKKKSYNSGIYFIEPLYIPDETEPVYGIAFHFDAKENDEDNRMLIGELEENINTYLRYICCTCKWLADGGDIDIRTSVWRDDKGNKYIYSLEDKFFKDYTDNAWKVHPIRYNIVFGNVEFKDEELDDDWIIKIN